MAVTPRKVSPRVYRRRRIAAALALLLVLGLVVLTGGWGYTAFRFRQISSVHVRGLGKAPSDGSVNLLVVGSDTRQGPRDGGFGEVVDALGGVSMYFPRPVGDDNNGRNESGPRQPVEPTQRVGCASGGIRTPTGCPTGT